MNLARVLILIPICAIVASCSKANDGFAPTMNPPATPPATILDLANVNMKYGTTVTTSSGWVIDADQADPVQAKITANGWQVEIIYE